MIHDTLGRMRGAFQSWRAREGRALREEREALRAEVSELRETLQRKDARLEALRDVEVERDRLARELEMLKRDRKLEIQQATHEGVRRMALCCGDLLSAYGQGVLRYHERRGSPPRSALGLSAPLEELLRFVESVAWLSGLSEERAEMLRKKLEEGKGPWPRRPVTSSTRRRDR